MQTEIRGRGQAISNRTREQVEKRVRFALSRFASSIRQVDVQLEAAPQRKRPERRCRITVRFCRGGELMLADSRQHTNESISRAAERMARKVAQRLDREQCSRRGDAITDHLTG